ncbi:hypothetical protein H6F61_04955 [Cyanobacteria bacterium FACHB-472]|nr:hypothetical protein [Cyanobacteria bacterium FACHB-472]
MKNWLQRYTFVKLIWGCLQPQWILILSLGIWTLGVDKLQAVTENSASPQQVTTENSISLPVLENGNLPPKVTEAIISVTGRENLHLPPDSSVDGSSLELHDKLKSLDTPPFLMAAPQNFNPELRTPPPPPPSPPPPPEVTSPSESSEPEPPVGVIENIQIDFRNDTDNFGQRNQFIEPTAQFRLMNGNIIRLKTGFNSFEQKGVESITNIPIQVGWEGKIDQLTVQTAVGVDLFNRLPTALNFNTKVDVPIGQNVTLSGAVEQGPYKFNAQTLENQITAWRYGPNLYWQIDRNTSLFSLLRFGSYNDGNFEQQSFSRLERKFGQFSVAANLFNWSYTRDREQQSGYFSPSDFLVYNAELAWEGDVFDFLSCRLAATLGQQRLRGKFDNANTYQARCTAKLSPNLEADLGYAFSNVQNREAGAGSSYNNNSLTGQLRVKF